MIDLGYAIANLPQPLLNWREHGDNVSAAHWETQWRSVILSRLAHRVRNAGLPVPFEGVETIGAELIRTVPAHLRQGMEIELFANHYNRVSLAGNKEPDAAWRHYLQLDAQTQRDTRMYSFLLLLFKRTMRKQKYCIALRTCAEAFHLHPRMTCRLLWKKFKITVSV